MVNEPTDLDRDRRIMLRPIVEAYFAALVSKDLTQVPWHDDVVLRTPLAPGGADTPIQGRTSVEAFFAAVIPIIAAVQLEEVYFSEDGTSAAGRATISITQPPCVLRVVDTFDVDVNSRILLQENHFDPRPATDRTKDTPAS